MATVRDWAAAYLEQARADLNGAAAIAGDSPSAFAMMLQMVFEKYAKAALLRSGGVNIDWARRSHAAASRMLQVLRRQRQLLEPIGGARSWQDVLWVVDTLERAHPQLAPAVGPQLEYPWEDLARVARWPARDLSIATTLATTNLGARVLRFADLLSQRFDQIFP